MATYLYIGDHAETVYVDDKCIPIGLGEEVEIPDEALGANENIMDDMINVDEAAAQDEAEAKAAKAEAAKEEKGSAKK